jgi:hypothetical protein
MDKDAKSSIIVTRTMLCNFQWPKQANDKYIRDKQAKLSGHFINLKKGVFTVKDV